jgi:hypothetical protein
MKKIILFSILIFLISVFFAKTTAQTIYPYLQTPKPTSIYITWKTSSNPQTLVEYGLSASSLTMSSNGTNQIWSDNGYPNNYYYHTVKLSGLTPNTKYYYKVTTGGQSSAICSFKTLPNPGQASTTNGHIRFLIMGDNQIKAEPRFDSLNAQAKRKLTQLYGSGDFCDNIALNFMVGDQVDVGTLDHYEYVHFAKNKDLSPYIPIQTTVGNHELYGTLQLGAYNNHFYLDSLPYQGINSGTENYYAIQAGPVLFISLSTEHTSGSQSATQFSWLQQVISAANSDATVQWIVSLGHRPYQAEQYVGDISAWVRNTAVPYMSTSSKYVLHIGAHHHLYARGQLKSNPVYNVISGGTAWDQYWGMATEQDFDDVQKTISQWAYSILDFDVTNQKMDAETYSIGSAYHHRNNMLIDSFHRYKNQAVPNTPSITNIFPDSLQLPYTITGSAYGTSVAGELLNTTEFQISQTSNFASNEIDRLRDYENLFGSAGDVDTSADVNLGVNIQNLDMPAGYLPNGWHYIRVRHRDRNLEWSAWSAVDSFKIYNSSASGAPTLSLDQDAYELTDTIFATYNNGPGLADDWIGIYQLGQTPGGVGSTQWHYVTGPAGVMQFTNLSGVTPGMYFAAFFTNDGYTEVAPRDTFYLGPIPSLASDSTHYHLGSPVKITYTNCPGFTNDWVGIYKVGNTPGPVPSTLWQYSSGTNGQLIFNGLPKGYYFANYFLTDGYTEPTGRIYFSVGDTITNLMIDKSIYNLNEYITASWYDAPGIVKDWLGIYDSLANPNIDPLTTYTYFGGTASGVKVIQDTVLPAQTGSYFIVMFTNDSYNEVSNRCYFEIVDTTATGIKNVSGNDMSIQMYPNPSTKGGKTVIESKYMIDRIQFLNSQGQEIFISNNIKANNFSFVNTDLPPGTYFVRIYQDNRTVHTYKLIIAPY